MAKILTYTPNLKSQYLRLYNSMNVPLMRQILEIKAVGDKIIKNKLRYELIGNRTGVPWYLIGLLHNAESGGNFSKHLHNGDPLTGRTINEPPGRPKFNPGNGSLPPSARNPYKFEESAIDAINYMKAKNAAWQQVGNNYDIPAILYLMEAYNGFGYMNLRNPINTPYLWSYTDHYTKGKYVADRKYDPNAVSKQPGLAPVLEYILNTEKKKVGFKLPGWWPFF